MGLHIQPPQFTPLVGDLQHPVGVGVADNGSGEDFPEGATASHVLDVEVSRKHQGHPGRLQAIAQHTVVTHHVALPQLALGLARQMFQHIVVEHNQHQIPPQPLQGLV